jgi:hypothetical protein
VGNVLTWAVTGLSPNTPYYYRVRAVNSGGASASSGTINVTTYALLTITTASPLPSGTVAVAYSQALAATGGLAPYTWSLASGALPTGWTLSSAGLISGTTTLAGVYNFTAKVRATNADSTTKAFVDTVKAGTATKLVYGVQPANTGASTTITPAVTVIAQDANSNPVTTFTGNVTIAIGTNPSSGVLGGTLTVPAVAGVATFSNLSINLAGNGYTLVATSGTLTSATSNAFNITAGSAFRLTFATQPTSDTAGTGMTPAVTVRVEDNIGNLVTSSTAGVSLAFGTNPSGATLSGGGVVSAVNGIATFSAISIDKVGTGYTLVASSTGLTGATSTAFNITPGSATKLVLVTQPSTLDTAGRVFSVQPVLQLQDANSNVATSDTSTVTASLNFGLSTLQGTTAVKAVNGVARFTNLSYNLAETIALNFSRAPLTTVTSSNVSVVANVAGQVVFVLQPPPATQAGVPFSGVTVQLKDAFGNKVATSSTVSLSLVGTGTLTGGTAQAVDGTGLAAFSNLSVNLVGSKRLVATSSLGVTQDTSVAFTVTPQAASKLSIQTQPPATTTAGVLFSPQPVVLVQDAFGNTITTATNQVTVAKGRGAGTLTGTVAVNAVAGVATFTNLAYTGADTTSLVFSDFGDGLSSATSTTIAVSPGVFKTFAVEAAGGGPIPAQTAGSTFTIQITAKDSTGNTVTSFSGTVNLTTTGKFALGGGTTPAFTNGVLGAYQVTFDSAGTFTITATRTSGGTQAGTSAPFTINPGALTTFLVESAAGGIIPTQTAGVPFNIKITARDGNSNTITSFTGPVTLTSANGRLLGAPLTSSPFVSGILASQGVRLDSAGASRVITATSGLVSASSAPFTVNLSAPSKVRVETAADGTGGMLGKQNITSGTSITVYAIRRDSLNNFIDNAAATAWALQVVSGGIVQGDFVPSTDKKSAVFSGALVGKALIQVSIPGLISSNSDTLTVVVAGAPSRISVETAANGTGTIVGAQSIVSGKTLTVYAVSRDAANNFIGPVLSNWKLINRTGGVASSDIDPPSGDSHAIFTARLAGSAAIEADFTGLTPIPSGKITVIPGAPVSASVVAGTSGQSAIVNAVYPVNLAVTVKDSIGNVVPGITANFSAPATGASGTFTTGNTAVTDTNGIARIGPFRANTRAGSFEDTARVAGVRDSVLFAMTNIGSGPKSLTADSAAAVQSTSISLRFPHPLSVAVKDTFGNPSPSVTVAYTVLPGVGQPPPSGVFSSGFTTDQAQTNASGIATPLDLSANNTAGTFHVWGTVGGLSPAVFTLTNVAGSVSGVTKLGGSNQTKLVGAVFDSVLVAQVLDVANNPVPGIMVRFIAPSTGASARFGGTRSIDSILTNASGIARSSSLTADSVAGAYTISAYASGISTPADFFLTNTAGPVASFLLEAANGGPIGTQLTQTTFDIKITARDRFNNTATSFSDSVFVASSQGTLISGAGNARGFSGGVLPVRTMEFRDAGSWTITATRIGGLETGTSNAIQVNNPVPAFGNISPGSAKRGSAVDIQINGSGFIAGVSSLSFGNNISTQKQSVISFATMTATLAIDTNAVEGARTFLITNTGPGGGVTTVTNAFSIGSNPKPGIVSIAPATSSRLLTLDVVVHGTNFIAGITSVSLGPDVLLNSTTIDSTTGLTANITISPSAATGPRNVVVKNISPGGGTDTLKNGFIVTNPAPTLTSIVPSVGNRSQTLDVVFTGTKFVSGATGVDFADTAITQNSVAVNSSTQLTANITITGGAATGVHNVTVTNPAPGGGTSSGKTFTISNPAPTLASVTPASALRGGDTTIVLRGTNFVSGVTTLNIGAGITVLTTHVDSVNQITAAIAVLPTAATGLRTVTVANPAPGGGTSAPLAFTIVLPVPAAPVALSPMNGASRLYTRQSPRWSWPAYASSFRFQLSLAVSFASPVLDDSTLTDSARVIAGLLPDTIYYWRVDAKNIGGTGPYSAVSSFRTGPQYPATLKFAMVETFPVHANPNEFKGTDYKLFGLPGWSARVLGSYLTGTARKNWTAYWDNGAALNYFMEYDGLSNFVMNAGRAFWLLNNGVCTIADSLVLTQPLDSIGNARIELHAGWNLITNPFQSIVSWSMVQALNGNFTAPLWQFVDGGFSPTDTLAPYTGYYFDNTASALDSLSIPFAGLPDPPYAVAKKADAGGWQVGIAVLSSISEEHALKFGTAATAAEGVDALDYRKPRALVGIPAASFEKMEADGSTGSFAADIRPGVKEVEKWPFTVKWNGRRPLELAFDGVAGIPEQWDAYLVDETAARSVNLRSSPSYTYTQAIDNARFFVVVGTPAAVKKELDAVVPKEFALGANFPNPFNPSTTIPVSVPTVAEVRLTVYNILGQEIRTLQAGPLQAGRYWFVWDGRNERGNPVATGVYLSRLTTTGGKQFVGKMLLLK